MCIEKSADESDMASDTEITFTENALAAVQSRVKPQYDPDFNGKDCLDCGDELPQLRLEYGRIRCVHCQQVVEARHKLYAE